MSADHPHHAHPHPRGSDVCAEDDAWWRRPSRFPKRKPMKLYQHHTKAQLNRAQIAKEPPPPASALREMVPGVASRVPPRVLDLLGDPDTLPPHTAQQDMVSAAASLHVIPPHTQQRIITAGYGEAVTRGGAAAAVPGGPQLVKTVAYVGNRRCVILDYADVEEGPPLSDPPPPLLPDVVYATAMTDTPRTPGPLPAPHGNTYPLPGQQPQQPQALISADGVGVAPYGFPAKSLPGSRLGGARGEVISALRSPTPEFPPLATVLSDGTLLRGGDGGAPYGATDARPHRHYPSGRASVDVRVPIHQTVPSDPSTGTASIRPLVAQDRHICDKTTALSFIASQNKRAAPSWASANRTCSGPEIKLQLKNVVQPVFLWGAATGGLVVTVACTYAVISCSIAVRLRDRMTRRKRSPRGGQRVRYAARRGGEAQPATPLDLTPVVAELPHHVARARDGCGGTRADDAAVSSGKRVSIDRGSLGGGSGRPPLVGQRRGSLALSQGDADTPKGTRQATPPRGGGTPSRNTRSGGSSGGGGGGGGSPLSTRSDAAAPTAWRVASPSPTTSSRGGSPPTPHRGGGRGPGLFFPGADATIIPVIGEAMGLEERVQRSRTPSPRELGVRGGTPTKRGRQPQRLMENVDANATATPSPEAAVGADALPALGGDGGDDAGGVAAPSGASPPSLHPTADAQAPAPSGCDFGVPSGGAAVYPPPHGAYAVGTPPAAPRVALDGLGACSASADSGSALSVSAASTPREGDADAAAMHHHLASRNSTGTGCDALPHHPPAHSGSRLPHIASRETLGSGGLGSGLGSASDPGAFSATSSNPASPGAGQVAVINTDWLASGLDEYFSKKSVEPTPAPAPAPEDSSVALPALKNTPMRASTPPVYPRPGNSGGGGRDGGEVVVVKEKEAGNAVALLSPPATSKSPKRRAPKPVRKAPGLPVESMRYVPKKGRPPPDQVVLTLEAAARADTAKADARTRASFNHPLLMISKHGAGGRTVGGTGPMGPTTNTVNYNFPGKHLRSLPKITKRMMGQAMLSFERTADSEVGSLGTWAEYVRQVALLTAVAAAGALGAVACEDMVPPIIDAPVRAAEIVDVSLKGFSMRCDGRRADVTVHNTVCKSASTITAAELMRSFRLKGWVIKPHDLRVSLFIPPLGNGAHGVSPLLSAATQKARAFTYATSLAEMVRFLQLKQPQPIPRQRVEHGLTVSLSVEPCYVQLFRYHLCTEAVLSSIVNYTVRRCLAQYSEDSNSFVIDDGAATGAIAVARALRATAQVPFVLSFWQSGPQIDPAAVSPLLLENKLHAGALVLRQKFFGETVGAGGGGVLDATAGDCRSPLTLALPAPFVPAPSPRASARQGVPTVKVHLLRGKAVSSTAGSMSPVKAIMPPPQALPPAMGDEDEDGEGKAEEKGDLDRPDGAEDVQNPPPTDPAPAVTARVSDLS